jgi:hypothetical protein
VQEVLAQLYNNIPYSLCKPDLITTKNTEGHGKANQVFLTAENAEYAEELCP